MGALIWEALAVPIKLAILPGALGPSYSFGTVLAYLSLFFGTIFFAFAARYYLATVAVLVSPAVSITNGKNWKNGNQGRVGNGVNGMNNLPKISVHLALYNEELVVQRLLTACSKLDYPDFEVVVVDDSNDGTVGVLKDWLLDQLRGVKPKFKIIHRADRTGFKGGALNEALRNTDPGAAYVVVFDADFVPAPDTLKRFLEYFSLHGEAENGESGVEGNGGAYGNGRLAAVQGYQWHTLNRTENWLTRGVSCEFSGNYMIDRTSQEMLRTMKMVAGSVYMVKADLLRELGWSTSLTEDWELTLRLYEGGHRVLYTSLIQAPAECPSSFSKLVRQRMRWSEGHSFNVKKHFSKILRSPKVRLREKLEFLYYAPYYLQSLFLIVGTALWFVSDIALGSRLPFWTATLGWGLVFTNLLSLPVMSLAGLFLERRARADFTGILSQFALIYALAPYQAYASLKGFLEPAEGSWVRTFKSGKVTGFPGRLDPRKVIKDMLPPSRGKRFLRSGFGKNPNILVVGIVALLAIALVQGLQAAPTSDQPAYYFHDQPAPQGYQPYPSTPPGSSFLMHLMTPTGPEVLVSIGSGEATGVLFFSDPAPATLDLPFGASVSLHVWINSSYSNQVSGGGNGTLGNLKFRIDVYDPSTNSLTNIPGVGETEVFHLQPGLDYYQTSWGHIAENKVISKGETLVVDIWCPDCSRPPTLVFDSAAHSSNIDFPIEVPENSLALVGVSVSTPLLAGLLVEYRTRTAGRIAAEEGKGGDAEGIRRIQGILIVCASVVFLTLPLTISFSQLLTSLVSSTGLDRYLSAIVPYEAGAVSEMLRGLGLQAGNSAGSVWLGGRFIPVTALISWNCSGWQSFLIFGITAVTGIREVRRRWQVVVLAAGILSVLAIEVTRIFLVILLGYLVSYPAALLFHDYGGTLIILVWLLAFWTFVMRFGGRRK